MVELINNINLEIIDLYRANYFNQFHIREMAKLIRKSHVGLLPNLRKLEDEKIILSKQVGKSKVFSLNLNNNQAKELIVLAEKKRTLELLNKEFFIKKIYDEYIKTNLNGCLILFGSYASGINTKESDIDLIYIGEISKNEKEIMKNLGKIYNKEIHLTIINSKEFKKQLKKQNALIKEIVKNHVVLYNHDFLINELWRYYNEKREI
ncbi:nucleotidyltransferase domain-containing protein [Candidatus Woesearchaeota archaeon]|nr:nucleotidyltransferase domain-containing protein [Candidatus Woesearchaeota archaeon]